MIEQANIDQRERLAQAAGDKLIRLARLGDARGMVVSDQYRGGAMMQAALDHPARMHLRAADAALEQFFESEQAMSGVEERRGEHLVAAVAQAGREQLRGIVRVEDALDVERPFPASRIASPSRSRSDSSRWPRLAAASNLQRSTGVRPGGPVSPERAQRIKPESEPERSIILRARLTTSSPRTPDPRKMASTSASLRASAPASSRRSRGRSELGQSFSLMFTPASAQNRVCGYGRVGTAGGRPVIG